MTFIDSEEPPPIFRLRGRQQEWCDKTEEDLKQFSRVLFIASGGVGKSTCFAELARRAHARGQKTLVIINRESLVHQSASRIRNETGLDVEVEMAEERASPYAPVVVASVQTLGRIPRLTSFAPDHFYQVMVDEVHLAMCPQWLRIMDWFTWGPDSLNDQWERPEGPSPLAKVIGFTATPILKGAKNLMNWFQHISVNYPYFMAVKEGWLVRAEQRRIPVKIDVRRARTTQTQTGADFNAADLSAALVPVIEQLADQVLREAGDRKTIAFLPSVETSRMLAEALCRRGMDACFVSGACEDGDEKTERFRRGGAGSVLCNAQIYNFGIDFPDVNCVAWFRATLSRPFYCLDSQTEILTRDGWKFDVKEGELVAAFDHKTGIIKYVPALATIRRQLYPNEHFQHIRTKSADIRVTGNHRMLYDHKRRTGWKFRTADEIAGLKQMSYIPVCGLGEGQTGVPLTDDELRFIGWVMTDGSINKITNAINICQGAHQPWLEEIEKCIIGCGFKFNRYQRTRESQFNSNSEAVHWTISFGKPRLRDKHLTGWGRLKPWLSKNLAEPLMALSPCQFKVLLDAINMGDGCKFRSSPNYIHHTKLITTGNREFADRLQILAIRCGYRCAIKAYSNHYNGNTNYRISIGPQKFVNIGGQTGDRRTWRIEHGEGEICWCVENELGTIVTRRNGRVAIVGNCQGVFRGTRVLPGVIDGLETVEERLAAIAASRKPNFLILDPLFMSDKISLCDTYDLFAEKPEVKEAMKEAGVEPSQENAEKAERDMLKALEKAAKKAARKKASTIDPLAFAVSLGDEALAHYEPETEAQARKPSPEQLRLLSQMGVKVDAIKCHGHAQMMIGRLLMRNRLGLAKPWAVNFLHSQQDFFPELGLTRDSIAKMSEEEADAVIARIKAEKNS